MNAKIEKIAHDLFLIPLNPPITGFSQFISAWLYCGKTTCLVDVGPSITAANLLRALQDLDIADLDYILLTHIHLDHAGAIAEIAAAFPQTPIVCHQAAISHLIDPLQLWEQTQRVLGPMALSYGPIQPVPGDRLLDASEFCTQAVTAHITPGHAAHHVSYQTDKYLFAGEAAGVFLALPENRFYLRPATPARFFLEDALQSVDTLIACGPHAICYAHFGIHQDAVKMLKTHRRQLQFWKKRIKAEIDQYAEPDRINACLKRLLKEDARMATFNQLRPDLQQRERYFLQNSINGYIGYLAAAG